MRMSVFKDIIWLMLLMSCANSQHHIHVNRLISLEEFCNCWKPRFKQTGNDLRLLLSFSECWGNATSPSSSPFPRIRRNSNMSFQIGIMEKGKVIRRKEILHCRLNNACSSTIIQLKLETKLQIYPLCKGCGSCKDYRTDSWLHPKGIATERPEVRPPKPISHDHDTRWIIEMVAIVVPSVLVILGAILLADCFRRHRRESRAAQHFPLLGPESIINSSDRDSERMHQLPTPYTEQPREPIVTNAPQSAIALHIEIDKVTGTGAASMTSRKTSNEQVHTPERSPVTIEHVPETSRAKNIGITPTPDTSRQQPMKIGLFYPHIPKEYSDQLSANPMDKDAEKMKDILSSFEELEVKYLNWLYVHVNRADEIQRVLCCQTCLIVLCDRLRELCTETSTTDNTPFRDWTDTEKCLVKDIRDKEYLRNDIKVEFVCFQNHTPNMDVQSVAGNLFHRGSNKVYNIDSMNDSDTGWRELLSVLLCDVIPDKGERRRRIENSF